MNALERGLRRASNYALKDVHGQEKSVGTTPIFRYVYGKTQKEALEKMHQQLEDYRGVELTE